MDDKPKRPISKKDIELIDTLTKTTVNMLRHTIRSYLDGSGVDYREAEVVTLPVIVESLTPSPDGDGHTAAAHVLVMGTVEPGTTISILQSAIAKLKAKEGVEIISETTKGYVFKKPTGQTDA